MNLNRRDFIKAGGLAAVSTVAGRSLRAGPAQSRRLRVAQIGTTHSHAAAKWETLPRLGDQFEVVGIWEPDPAAQQEAEREPEFRGARWLSEDELFGDSRLDAVLVETELPDLLAYGRRAVEAGWHVHLDKPPGANLADFVALQELAAQRGRVLQMGYMFRYHPAFRFCLDAVQRGWLGELFAIHGDIGKALDPARRPWLAENYRGSMMLLGCHLLDFPLVLLGRPAGCTAHRRNTFPAHDRFHDNELAVLDYPRALATIRSLLAEVGGDDRRQLVVCGTRGTVTIAPLEPAQVTLKLAESVDGFAAGTHAVPVPPLAGRYDAMLADFAGMIAGQPSTAPEFTPAHDRLLHEILLATAGFASTSTSA